MTVGLLIISHNKIGDELLATATATLGICPLLTETLRVTSDADLDALREQAWRLVTRLDQGAGVLVLTDTFGSTPSNIAYQLLERPGVRVVTGINLPMMLRILNYPQLQLDALAQKAVSGGRDGIVDCHHPPVRV